MINIYGGDGEVAATPRDSTRRPANGKLFASAPDLLAALEQMLRPSAPKIRAANGFDGNLAHAAAYAAIAAARGTA